MLSVFARSAGSAMGLRALACAPAVPCTTRALSGFGDAPLGGLKGYSEKERAIENQFFNKEDERLLRKLLSKVKKTSDVTDKHAAVGVAAQEKASLESIVGKYNMSEEDLAALIEWRHHHEH